MTEQRWANLLADGSPAALSLRDVFIKHEDEKHPIVYTLDENGNRIWNEDDNDWETEECPLCRELTTEEMLTLFRVPSPLIHSLPFITLKDQVFRYDP